MFSSRLPASLAENRISRAVAAAQGRDVIDLTETNPTVVGLRYPDVLAMLTEHAQAALTYAPTPHGLVGAREAVAGYYARRHGRTIDPGRLFLTASTSEAYAWLFKLLCDPGDEVLVPHPSYPLFDYLAALESVRLVPYPLRY